MPQFAMHLVTADSRASTGLVLLNDNVAGFEQVNRAVDLGKRRGGRRGGCGFGGGRWQEFTEFNEGFDCFIRFGDGAFEVAVFLRNTQRLSIGRQ
jgi:hypothetical protein